MINLEALFKVSYGLYIVTSGNKEEGNGFISNTFFQVTAEPPAFAACCNKDNYTSELIQKTQAFGVSVLEQESDIKLIGKFGYKSGKTIDKLQGSTVKYGETGVPLVLDNAISLMECKVTQTIDVGTHWIFIGELVSSELLVEDGIALTYAHYRDVKKGIAPKNAPTYIDKSKLAKPKPKAEKHKCIICGYIHDDAAEDTAFDDLPSGWSCPVCGASKDDFTKE
jgi:flavin reductase (DIM6/NTAB) family NADH-FMN oxidoreductase RutF/rubredoxin